MKKTIKTAIFAFVAVFLLSGLVLTSSVDSQAANTTTKTSTKTSTKVVKLKKAAKKKTTKKVSTAKKTKTYNESNNKVTEQTTVKTTKVTKVAAKQKKIITTVKTTVKTTKEAKSDKSLSNANGKLMDNGSNEGASFNVRSLNGLADPMVIKAFEQMNYKIVIDGSVSYAGKFDARNRQVTLKSANKSYLLHELGHFVSFITGIKDSTPEFVNIYKKEVGKYVGSNSAYVTKDNKEYFAESFRDYSSNPSALKSARPETYNYIKGCVDSIDDNLINYINRVYYGA